MSEPPGPGLEWSRIERARAALEAWPRGHRGRLTTINVGENATFRVAAPRGTFALRLYRPARWEDQEILVEHDFMRHLGTRFGVRPPLQGRDGETLQVLDGGPRAALFPWLPGRLQEHLGARGLQDLGAFVARLHGRGAGFRSSRKRLRWEAQNLVEGPLEKLRQAAGVRLPGLDLPGIEATAQDGLTRWKSQDLPEAMVHADLHWGNMKRYQGTILLLDFDDCGWAPLAYDLATVAYANPRCREGRLGVELLVAGYNQAAEHPVSSETVHLMMWARYLALVGWILDRPELFPDAVLATRVKANLDRAQEAGRRIGLGDPGAQGFLGA